MKLGGLTEGVNVKIQIGHSQSRVCSKVCQALDLFQTNERSGKKLLAGTSNNWSYMTLNSDSGDSLSETRPLPCSGPLKFLFVIQNMIFFN